VFKKLKDKDFFVQNRVCLKKGIIDYTKIFDNSIFIENGRKIFLKYGIKRYHRPNVKFQEAVLLMKKNKLTKSEILKEIIKYRFKKSKGSTNSIKLPLSVNENILKIAKFVRIRNGGISFSKKYILSFNEDFDKILKITENIFDIKPKYTCKNEPIFCSGVISDLFNKIIKRET